MTSQSSTGASSSMTIISPDRGFDTVREVLRLDPSEALDTLAARADDFER